jgi:hypothetical protein
MPCSISQRRFGSSTASQLAQAGKRHPPGDVPRVDPRAARGIAGCAVGFGVLARHRLAGAVLGGQRTCNSS